LWALCVAHHLLGDKFGAHADFVDDCHPELEFLLAADGMRLVSRPLVKEAPHCHKIGPLFDDGKSDLIIVTDTNLYFIADRSPLFHSARIFAAPNNHTNLPPEIFKAVLKKSGLSAPYRAGFSFYSGLYDFRKSHTNNYFLPDWSIRPFGFRQGVREAIELLNERIEQAVCDPRALPRRISTISSIRSGPARRPGLVGLTERRQAITA
jgi:hypothetical protein